MAEVPQAARAFYNTLARLRSKSQDLAARAWGDVSPAFLSESWVRIGPQFVSQLALLQVQAATAGSEYGAATLAAQGTWVPPEAFVDAGAFGGWASSGARLAVPMGSPIIDVKALIGGGMGVAPAMKRGLGALQTLSGLQVSDAGRGSAAIDTAARQDVGYTRMLNPPSCSRCVVLAGKFYRWNEGFRRHPRCDCVHVQTQASSTQAARSEGLVDDPYDYFHSLSEADQDRVFGQGYAASIRDGGDIYQVVNSKRGRVGAFTTEGTTRRGYARGSLNRGQRRMTPDTIYRLNPKREDALAALRQQGYILPGGQVPGGSLRGATYEGFGALGRGGTRRAASQAVLDARATGMRDGSRYTMTEAERRLQDAEQRYIQVLQGRNPFASPGFGSTPDPFGQRLNRIGAGPSAPLTPEIAALVETDYRRWLATGGQIFGA